MTQSGYGPKRAILRGAGLALAALAALAAAIGPAAAGPAADRLRFKALEQAWLDAISRHDAAALDRLLAPEFADTMWDGQLRDKQTAIEAARRSGLRHGTQRLGDLSVARYGEVAVVTGLDISADARVRFTDIFVHRGGRWQAVKAQETLVRDGAR